MKKKDKISIKKSFIGIDLHTNKFNICHLKEDSKERNRYDFLINKNDLERFTAYVDQNTYVMLESCANAFKFAKLIEPFVAKVIVADTHKLMAVTNTHKKTDKIDAEKIAKLLKIQTISGEELVNGVFIVNDKIQNLRSLFTTYNFQTNTIVRLKNRIHSLLKENLIVFPKSQINKTMRSKIKALELDTCLTFQFNLLIDELEILEKIKINIVNQIKIYGSEYYKQIEILTSVIGISVLSALAFIADTAADIKRFPNKKHLCSYLRSAPSVESSNNVTKIKKTNKFSRKLAMSFLTQSVAHFKKANPELEEWYNRKTLNTKKGKIRMATCRKIITQIYSMLMKEEFHRFRDEKNHTSKMKKYNYLLKKNGIIIETKNAV